MSDRVLDASDSGSSVRAAVGDRLLIRLVESPTNGYLWAADEFPTSVLALLGSEFTRAPESQLGGGGLRTFTFGVLDLGRGEVRLRLRRPWERDRPPAQEFALEVQVVGLQDT